MNCKEFEGMINDLACEHLMLATKRVQALAHTEICARCAARLAQERLLTEHLRLVADAEVVEAPTRVKASLMAAFAERNGISAAPAAAVLVKFEPANLPKPTAIRGWSRWAMVAAAAVLVLVAVVTIRLLNAEAPVNSVPNTTAEGTQEVAPQVKTPETLNASEEQKSRIVADNHNRPRQNAEKSPDDRQLAKNDTPRKVQSTTTGGNQPAQNEVVTDYIPLTYLNDSTAFDSGLVVRVQVPRSTLISMGVPMNVENSSELVKADVVVGDDGVARAIRFVHDLSARADSKQIKL
jgi:hypothetical protein